MANVLHWGTKSCQMPGKCPPGERMSGLGIDGAITCRHWSKSGVQNTTNWPLCLPYGELQSTSTCKHQSPSSSGSFILQCMNLFTPNDSPTSQQTSLKEHKAKLSYTIFTCVSCSGQTPKFESTPI